MLVKVRYGESQKYVKVAETEEGYESYSTFLQNLGLPLQSELHVTDESGTEVDADVFEELLQAGNRTVKVSTEQSSVSDSSDATTVLERDSGVKRVHADRESAKEIRAKHCPTVHCPGEEETCHCKKKGRMTFGKLGGREEMKG
ncbi:hypothetical protein JOQ06_026973 [Pogonophryne albipinna]|uniref:Uncharacterized protein n=1 Tax=Pogonophryne albipinna TaxID=1090488 RepID=A0AAD6FN88_9TELE|nr:hypothetical protein JOQ06_026973 [Pogonophryne albipinna]